MPKKKPLDPIKSFMQWWNVMYPVDRWWRQKHKVAFNSAAHGAMSLIDMKIEFEEDVMFANLKNIEEKEKSYKPGTGNWLSPTKITKMTEDEIDDAFDNFDIDNIKTNDEGQIIL